MGGPNGPKIFGRRTKTDFKDQGCQFHGIKHCIFIKLTTPEVVCWRFGGKEVVQPELEAKKLKLNLNLKGRKAVPEPS